MTADAALAAALMFTDEDLAANRAGQLSGRQAAMLSNARAGALRFSRRGVVFVVGFLVVVGAMLMLIESQASGVGAQAVLGVVASIAAAGLIVGLATRNSRRRWDAMASGAVYLARGPARSRTRSITGEDGVSYVYEVSIGATKFRVPGEHVLAAFTSGRDYAGYYVGKGMTAMLLSAEPM